MKSYSRIFEVCDLDVWKESTLHVMIIKGGNSPLDRSQPSPVTTLPGECKMPSVSWNSCQIFAIPQHKSRHKPRHAEAYA